MELNDVGVMAVLKKIGFVFLVDLRGYLGGGGGTYFDGYNTIEVTAVGGNDEAEAALSEDLNKVEAVVEEDLVQILDQNLGVHYKLNNFIPLERFIRRVVKRTHGVSDFFMEKIEKWCNQLLAFVLTQLINKYDDWIFFMDF